MKSSLISALLCVCFILSSLSEHLAKSYETRSATLKQPVFTLAGPARSDIASLPAVSPANAPEQTSQASADGIWQYVDETRVIGTPSNPGTTAQPHTTARLNHELLTELLRRTPTEFTDLAKISETVMSLPMPDGSFSRFRFEQSPVMEPGLADRFSDVKTYRGQGIDDPTATTRFDWMPFGFHAIVLSAQGTSFIEPLSEGDTTNYISYFNHDVSTDKLSVSCLVSESEIADAERRGIQLSLPGPAFVTGASLRTYRLAVAATGEFTQQYGGGNVTTALMKITTLVNQVNALYQKEAAITFQLVANETNIIFTDAATDGYTNNSPSTMLTENQTKLDAVIGSANYDIGHVFGGISVGPASVSFSGVAFIGVVCASGSKGKGVSTMGGASGSFPHSIFVSGLTHEIGHQFSARHTFNSTTSGCNGNRDGAGAYEPGSGSTIMAYSSCGSDNLQNLPDLYFHTGSLESIVSYAAASGNCAATAATGNGPPVISALSNFTIPANTPFTLSGSATDPNGDALTFNWEEYDLGSASPPNTDDGARPLFRSFLPSTNASRTLPRLQYILNNANVPPTGYTCGGATCFTGEMLPSTTRSMNFRLTVRDNRASGGGTATGNVQLNVVSTAGPFAVTQPNSAVSWPGASSQTVAWNVANTSGSPIGCANVKISLSTDGGTTFPTVLAASTPNDGTQTVVIPNVSTTTSTARIKVEAVGNAFFDISNTNFTITTSGTPSYEGYMDGAGCNIVTGWARDANQPNSSINVDIFDGNTFLARVPANLFREDVQNAGIGTGFYGFSFTVPQSLKNGQPHLMRAFFAGANIELGNSSRQIICSGAPPVYQGYHDGAGCNTISGWAWDANDQNSPINVDIYDGTTLIATIPAIIYRQDLQAAGIGNGYHGFSYTVPASLKDGNLHPIRIRFPGTSTDLGNTPRTIGCSGAAPQFHGTHEVANCNVISGWAWDQNDPNSPINVAIYADGQWVATVLAILFRQDLASAGIGNGYHGFSFNTPASLRNGQPHSILIRFSGTNTGLTSSPKQINCSGG